MNKRSIKLLRIIENKSFSEIKNVLEGPPYNCNVSEDGNYYLIKYNQIRSDFSNKAVCQARGIILRKTDNKIVCWPFEKFFNYGEKYASSINWDSAKVQEKIDGCCDKDVIVLTENGPKTIKEIVEKKEKSKVATFNILSEEIEFEEIIGFSKKENNNDWFEITLENNKTIKLTGNHLVYLPNLKCYRRVDELIGNEEIFFL